MRRNSFDKMLSWMGLILTVVFIVAGVLLMWGANFARGTVTDQLTAQKITFSEDAASLPPELASWAGVAVTTGDAAKAYSDLIAVHVAGATEGKSYSEASGAWFADKKPGPAADQNTPTSYDIRMTAFMGETLRGLLLEAYAFWTIGTIALYAAYGAFIAAILMLILTILGFRHAAQAGEATV